MADSTRQLTLKGLIQTIADYVDINKLGSNSYELSKDNTAHLIDKIGDIVTIPTNYVDKLDIFNGSPLPYGKDIEEWFQDLVLPVNPDDYSDEEALKYFNPTFRPTSYSITLGKKVIPLSFKYNDYQRAVLNGEQYAMFIAKNAQVLADSMLLFKYNLKREVIGKVATKAINTMATTTVFATNTAYTEGTYLKESAESNVRGVVVKEIPSTNSTTWTNLVANGSIVVLDLVTTIAKPTDTTTGEAFTIQLMDDVEIASDNNEGHSFNGNTIGAVPSDGLVLLVKHGVMSKLKVQTQAGAFHLDKVAIPTRVIPLPDFGNADDSIYAILIDTRMIRLRVGYDAMRENVNGLKDHITYFRHTENTAFVSNNTYFKVYKDA